ncbi:hypothetical protein N7513_005974 [Penicillium frequentans]|nr:hypothetical protein N7513_005974 [Penicillium glabrum]
MAWKVLPFQSPDTLRAQLPHLLSEPGVLMDPDGMALRSILFPMLSIGSITAGYADVGSMFIAEAQRNTLSADVVGDILVFQNSGCFTTAYMRLGATLPKILAAGMDKLVRTPQEQAIISAFCCHERLS